MATDIINMAEPEREKDKDLDIATRKQESIVTAADFVTATESKVGSIVSLEGSKLGSMGGSIPSLNESKLGSIQGMDRSKLGSIVTMNDSNLGSISTLSVTVKEPNRPSFASSSYHTKYRGSRATTNRRSTMTSYHSVRAAPGNMFETLFHAPPESKLAHKLYRKKSVYLKYGQTLKDNNVYDPTDDANSKWMIHPFSHFKVFWDGIVIFLLLFTLIVLPVGLAFYSDDQLQPQWVSINIVVDFLFVLDIIIIFRTGVLYNKSPERIVMNPMKVAKSYICSWFFVDFISSFPFDYISYASIGSQRISVPFAEATTVGQFLRIARLLGLLKLLRVTKILRYAVGWEDLFDIAGGFLRILKLVLTMLLLAHWNGCIQFLVPFLQGIPEDSWIGINQLQNATVGEQYSWALFKAMSHMLSIGYGRFPPQNVTEVWLTIVSMIVGATFYALFIGNISSLLLSSDSSGRLYEERLNQVDEYMRYRKIPQDFRTKVHQYYEYRYRRKFFDEEAILNNLSRGLRNGIISHNYRTLIQNTPLFQNANETFVTAVLARLNVEVFLKEEVIIQSGTKGDRMYFIARGSVEIVTDTDTVLNVLEKGSYFGEICLLTNDRRTATVRALTPCDLCTLNKKDFEELIVEFPEMKAIFESLAITRLSKLGERHSLSYEGKLLTSVSPPNIQLELRQ